MMSKKVVKVLRRLSSAAVRRQVHFELRRVVALIACAILLSPPGLALAGPSGEQVQAGNVNIARDGSYTGIEASNNSIINWDNFDIQQQETVQFFQPGANARVMNRVLGVDPTQINGTLLANGQVYILNQQGVYFGGTAIIDVAGLYAAAGKLSNADFLSQIDNFTDLTGDVANWGHIRADVVGLIGEHVVNHGTISAPEGLIALVAGDRVIIGQLGGNIVVKVDAPTASQDAAAGVENAGVLDAEGGRVMLAAGDFYSLAVRHPGSSRAAEITVAGGDDGIVEVSGTLDASSDSGIGGDIEVTGDFVALDGATLDASGDAGGGEILVGGDYQGRGEARNAKRTYVSGDSALVADAGTDGDGGKVIVWSDEATGFYGTISARGGEQGGDGGFAEVSGARALDYRGTADLRAPAGDRGTLLLDPLNIQISGSAGGAADGSDNEDTGADTLRHSLGITGDDTAAGSDTDGTIAANDEGVGDPDPFVVTESEIEAQSAMADIILQARQNITASGTFGVNGDADPAVTLADGSSLTLETVNATGFDGGIDLTGSDHGSDLVFETGGAGNITIQASTDGGGVGNVTVGRLQADTGTVTISSGNAASTVTLTGDVQTAGGNVNLTGAQAVALGADVVIDTDPTTGDTNAGNIDFGSTPVDGTQSLTLDATADGAGTSGDVTLGTVGGTDALTGLSASGNTVTLNGPVATTGDVTIAAVSNLSLPAIDAGAGNVSLSSAGSINGADDAGVEITTTGDVALSGNGIGETDPQSIDISSGAADEDDSTLTVVAQGAGDVNVEVQDNAFGAFDITGSGDALQDISVALSTGTDNISVTAGTPATLTADLSDDGTGTGDSLTYTQAAGAGDLNVGAVTTGDGDITLTADDVEFTGGASTVASTGAALLQPGGTDNAIDIGQAGAEFDLTTTDLAALADGFSGITVGRADGNHAITVAESTFADPVEIRTPDGGSIAVVGTLTANEGATLTGSGATTTLGADIVTTGAPIAINDAVVIADGTTVNLDTTNAGGTTTGANVTLGGTVGGGAGTEALNLLPGTDGTAALRGDVAATLESLDVQGAAALGGASAIAISAGTQRYRAAVTLEQDTTLTAATVNFDSTVDAASAGGASLTSNATTATFFGDGAGDDSVGAQNALSSVATTGTAVFDIVGASAEVTTTGTQTYDNTVGLVQDTEFAGSTVSFNGNVNPVAAGQQSLTVTGDAVLGDGAGDRIGLAEPLELVSVTGTTTINAGLVRSTGTQTYAQATTLGSTTELAGSTVSFQDTLAGSAGTEGLTVTGDASFAAGASSLAALDVTGTTSVGGPITTSGNQTFGGEVTMGGAFTLEGDTLTFNDALTAGGNATVLRGDEIDFDGGANSVTGSSSLALEPRTATQDVTTGFASDQDATSLDLTDGDLAALADGFSFITVGRAVTGNEHDVTISSSNFRDTVTFLAPDGRQIRVADTLTVDDADAGTTEAVALLGTDIVLGGDIVTSGSTIQLGSAATDAVSLADNATVTLDATTNGATAGAQIQILGTLDGDGSAANAESLTVNTGTNALGSQFAQNVGDTEALGSLTTQGTARIEGSSVAATTQDYTGDVTVLNDVTFSGTTVTFGGQLRTAGNAAASRNVTVTADGTTTFGDATGDDRVSDLASLTTDGGGTTVFDIISIANNVSTSGDQTYDDAVVLDADTRLSGANVTFNSSVDGSGGGADSNLDITLAGGGTGTATFGDGAGNDAVSNLLNLTVDGGTTVLDIVNGGGDEVTTVGLQRYGGPVELAQDTTLTSEATAVVFESTVSSSGTARALTVNAPGDTIFGDGSGSDDVTGLASITTDAPGTTVFNNTTGLVTTSGAQTYNDAVRLDQSTIFSASELDFNDTLQADVGFVNMNAEEIDFNGGPNSVSGMGANLSMTPENTTGINVGFDTEGAALDLSQDDLAALADGFNAITIGSSAGEHDIDIQSSVFRDPVTIQTPNGGSIDVQGTITASDGITLTGSGSTTTLGADIVTDGAPITIDDAVLVADNVAVTLDTTNGGTNAGGASVNVTGTIAGSGVNNDGESLTLRTGTDATGSRLQGDIGTGIGVERLGTLDVDGNLDFEAASINAVTQTYRGAVTLENDTTMNGGTVTFESTVDTAATAPFRALDVNASGTTTFEGLVGGTRPLESLTTDGFGTTVFGTNATTITTDGSQFYGDAVQLWAATEFAGTDVTFDSTVDTHPGAAVDASLTKNGAGVTTFNDRVGSNRPLDDLLIGVGGTNINIGTPGVDIETSDVQRHLGQVTLLHDTELTGSFLEFRGNVDGDVADARPLVINGGAMLGDDAGDEIGSTGALQQLWVNGVTSIGASSITSGSQRYNGAVGIQSNTTLTSDGTNVEFVSTVDSGPAAASSLTVNSQGVTSFGGAVGGGEPLAELTTDAGGTTRIGGGSVTTEGAQNYGDAVTLGVDTTLTGGEVVFESTVASPDDGEGNSLFRSLTVNSPGDTVFRGNVGSMFSLSTLTTDAPGVTDFNDATAGQSNLSVTTSGDQSYNDAVTVQENVTLNGQDVFFDSTVDGPGSLLVNTSLGGSTEFRDDVGSQTPLASLETNADGTTFIGDFDLNDGVEVTVSTTGNQTFNDPVLLQDDTVINSQQNVTFRSTVDSNLVENPPLALTVNAAGDTRFEQNVGNNGALAELTTDAPGTTYLGVPPVNGNGTQIFVVTQERSASGGEGGLPARTGEQTYNDPVVLRQDAVLLTQPEVFNGGPIDLPDVWFNSTVDSDVRPVVENDPIPFPVNLDVNAGTTHFGDDVGSQVPLNELRVFGATDFGSGGSPITVDTVGGQGYFGPSTVTSDTQLNAGRGVFFGGDVAQRDDGEGSASLAVDAGLSEEETGDILIGGDVTVRDFDAQTDGHIVFEVQQVRLFDSVAPVASSIDQTVTATGGNVSLNADGRATPEKGAIATIYKREGNLFIDAAQDVTIGTGERVTVSGISSSKDAGNLTITAADTATIGDLTANVVTVEATNVVVPLRDPGAVVLPGGGTVQDNGVDINGNQINITANNFSLDGQGKLTFGTPTRTELDLDFTSSPVLESGQQLASRSYFIEGGPISQSALVNGKTVLDGVPTGVEGDAPAFLPGVIPVLPEPPEPPDLGPEAPKADDVLAWLKCAQLEEDEEVPEECLPPVGARGEEGEGESAFDRPEFEAEDAVNALELYRGLLRNQQAVSEMQGSFQSAIRDYRAKTGATLIEGASFREYLETQPGHATAANYLDQIAFLMVQLKGMDLLPGEYQTLKEALLAELVDVLDLEGISPGELGEAIDASTPTQGRPAVWLRELFRKYGLAAEAS